jgi:hypothetical protein
MKHNIISASMMSSKGIKTKIVARGFDTDKLIVRTYGFYPSDTEYQSILSTDSSEETMVVIDGLITDDMFEEEVSAEDFLIKNPSYSSIINPYLRDSKIGELFK